MPKVKDVAVVLDFVNLQRRLLGLDELDRIDAPVRELCPGGRWLPRDAPDRVERAVHPGLVVSFIPLAVQVRLRQEAEVTAA